MNTDRIPGILTLITAFCYILGLALVVLVWNWDLAAGFAAGGGLMVLNQVLSAKRVKDTGFFSKGVAMASLMGGFYIRLIILGISLYALIRYAEVNPIGLVAGLSIVPAALIIMIIMIYMANRRPEEV